MALATLCLAWAAAEPHPEPFIFDIARVLSPGLAGEARRGATPPPGGRHRHRGRERCCDDYGSHRRRRSPGLLRGPLLHQLEDRRGGKNKVAPSSWLLLLFFVTIALVQEMPKREGEENIQEGGGKKNQ